MKAINLFIISISFFFVACGDGNDIEDYNFKKELSGDFHDLIPFSGYNKEIIGVDTVSFELKAKLTYKNMVVGGVAKLPDGGFVISSHNGASLLLADRNMNVYKKVACCVAPMGPKVVGNRLMIGSSAYESDLTMKFQVFETENFSILKEFRFLSDSDAGDITESDNNMVYLGIIPDHFQTYSYLVQLSLNSLDTVELRSTDNLFFHTGHRAYGVDSLAYIASSLNKGIGIYNLNTKETILTKYYTDYPALAVKDKLVRCRYPRVEGDYFYATFEESSTVYLTKFDRYTLDLVQLTRLEKPERKSNRLNGYEINYFGRFITLLSDIEIVFTDYRTGKTVAKVSY